MSQENIPQNEAGQVETVRQWLKELDAQITEKQRFLEMVKSKDNSLFYARLKVQVEKELGELLHTRAEYEELLEVAEQK